MEAFFPIVFGSKQINAVFSLEKEVILWSLH